MTAARPILRIVLFLVLATTLPAAAADPSRGRALFERAWNVDGSAGTGLGPLFNARSCADCHPGGGRGDRGGPALVLRLAGDPSWGAQLQTMAVPGSRPEGSLEVGWQSSEVVLGDGTRVDLRRPVPSPSGSLRLAPSLRGVAQLASISRTVASNDHEQAPPGRFGRTASEPSLEGQVSLALSLDLGIGSPLRPGAAGDCTPAEEACLALAGTRPIEADARTVDALVDYLETLRPRPSALTTTDVTHGEDLLARFGCAGCHHAAYTIPADPALTGTTSETIRPYTDLRLHDLGEDLADPVTKRWRTAPLRDLADGNLLHDGRAADPLEAILWHGGEATEARERVRVAAPDERAALLAFLARL